jgi:hypothetical protein
MEASSASGIISPTAFLRSRFLISSGPVDRGGQSIFNTRPFFTTGRVVGTCSAFVNLLMER